MTSKLLKFADRREVPAKRRRYQRPSDAKTGDTTSHMRWVSPRWSPGTGIALHTHNTVEQVVVLSGTGMVELNGESKPVEPFDATHIPEGEVHRFYNTGDETLRILWVYGATHVMRTWVETGEVVEQLNITP